MELRWQISALALTTALAVSAHGQTPRVLLPTDQDVLKPTTENDVKPPVAQPTAPAFVGPSLAAPPARVDGTAALIRQARNWRERGRKDLANDALRRALSTAPRNSEVLYLLALYSAQDGNLDGATGWLTRLKSVAGAKDGRVVAVERLVGTKPTIPVVTIADAAQDSDRTQTSGLGQSIPLPPAMRDAAAASARAANQAASTRATANTIVRTPPAPVDRDPGGPARASGFVLLNEGKLGQADTQFQRAIAARSSDLESRAGLGIVRLRQQRFAEAERLLVEAMRGPNPSRWQEALDTSRFFNGLLTARDAAEAGKLAEAETAVRKVLDGSYPDKTEARLLLADLLSRQQRYAEAEVIYQDLIGRMPARPEVVAGLAETLSRTGRDDEAIRLLEKLPRTPAALEARARIERARATSLLAKGDTFGAGSALAAALDADPANPWTRYEYAKFLAGLGQVQQATEVAAPLFSPSRTDPETLQAAALYADFAGSPDRAQTILQQIAPRDRNAAVRDLAERVDAKTAIAQALAMQRSGQGPQAVSLLREVLSRSQLPFGAKSQIAQTLFELGDTYQAGTLALQAAREPVPADVRPVEGTGFLVVLGAGGQDAAANTLLQQLSQRIRAPQDQAAWRQAYAAYAEQRSDNLRLAGDLANAFDVLSSAMAMAPRDAGLLAALARVYAAGNMPREAGQTYDAVLAVRPNDPAVMFDAARVAASSNDFDRAARLMDRVLRLNPNNPELYYELGRIEQARGRERAAMAAFERAERLVSGGNPNAGRIMTVQGSLGPNPFARVASPMSSNSGMGAGGMAGGFVSQVPGQLYGQMSGQMPNQAYGQMSGQMSGQTAVQMSVPMQTAPGGYAAYAPAPASAGYAAGAGISGNARFVPQGAQTLPVPTWGTNAPNMTQSIPQSMPQSTPQFIPSSAFEQTAQLMSGDVASDGPSDLSSSRGAGRGAGMGAEVGAEIGAEIGTGAKTGLSGSQPRSALLRNASFAVDAVPANRQSNGAAMGPGPMPSATNQNTQVLVPVPQFSVPQPYSNQAPMQQGFSPPQNYGAQPAYTGQSTYGGQTSVGSQGAYAAQPAYNVAPVYNPTYNNVPVPSMGAAQPMLGVPAGVGLPAQSNRQSGIQSAQVLVSEPDVDTPILGGRISALTDPNLPLAVRIRSEISAAELDSIPLAEGTITARVRSGETGTSNLTEIGGVIEATAPIRGIGQFGVRVRPVAISAGTPTGATIGRLGAYPLITAPGIVNGVPITLPAQRARTDAGVEGALLFRSGWLSGDVGISPYGFQYSDIIGGFRATPQFGRLELRVSAERRAVEDSVLSWAGDIDPITGLQSGGVRRTAGNLGFSLTGGSVGGYFDGSYRRFSGRNTPDNDSIEFNGGFYWRLINETDQRLQVGLNANYQTYDRNLRYFTLGHGGYFSPQQFIAVGFPINYSGAGEDWRIQLNLTPGIQSFSEDTTPIFPNFAALQGELVSQSLLDDAVPAFYLGTSRTGFGIASKLSGEYRIQNRTTLGGLLSLDTFGAFSDFRFNIILRQQLKLGN